MSELVCRLSTVLLIFLLIEAINHYIATGDHFGEGSVFEAKSGEYLIPILFDPTDSIDSSDFEKFACRLDEIRDETGLKLVMEREGKIGRCDSFHLRLEQSKFLPLAKALVSRPSEKGWGSMHNAIQRLAPGLRDEILNAK